MTDARKIAVLEGLLARVQRNAAAPRPSRHEPTTVRPAAASLPSQSVPERRDAGAGLPPRPDLTAPREPLGTLAGLGPEEHRAPPDARPASAPPPPSVVLVDDDAPIALEAGGEADEVLDDADEVDLLSEGDLVPSGPEALSSADELIPVEDGSGGELDPSARSVPTAEAVTVVDELIPAEDAPALRPRTVPPPLPPSTVRPSPLPSHASEISTEDLEADSVLPKPRPALPTTEQLGNTLDLEEGPEAALELAASPAPPMDVLSEQEAELPLAQAPGQYKLESLPAPETPPDAVLDEHAPPRAPASVELSSPVAAVHLVAPASPPPAELPAEAPAPPPVRVDLAPGIVAPARRRTMVPAIVTASRAEAPATWAELVRASMKLG